MKQQLNSLQLYRGLASILVVLHHANIILDRELQQDGSLKIFHFGWVGVDFFFVLSGFIIFYIHQSDLGHSSRFKSFITKRFLRIYPLYWLVLFCKILLSLIGESNSAIAQTSLVRFIQILFLVPQPGTNLTNFIGVSWTLTYEIFFYILFGMLILLKPKLSQIIGTIWIFGLIANVANLLPTERVFLLSFIFNIRNLEFIFGCLAAYTVSRFNKLNGKLLIGIALGMLTISILNTKYQETGISADSSPLIYGIPFAILIVGSVALEKSTAINIPPLLIYLGNASYSIYLTHGFILNNITRLYLKFAQKYNPNLLSLRADNILYMAISLLIVMLSIGFGCIIYSAIERPMTVALRGKVG
jgi:exopolysaccharide production protein ExoZ